MNIVGPCKIAGVFHGSPDQFETFQQSPLKSLGFHFGDIGQAQCHAGNNGWIYRANLMFENLIDIGDQDWGWTTAGCIAFAFYTACLFGRIPTSREDFVEFLGQPPWFFADIKKTDSLSEKEQNQLIALFRSYDFDGVQYVNKFEPPNNPGNPAYFVLSPAQINLLEIRKVQAS
jgi:hypothetical protein